MSDTYGGVKYESSAKKIIIQVIKPDLKDFEVPNSVEEIKGGSKLDSAFYQCRNSIKHISFEYGSQFQIFGSSIFQDSVIETADFSQCTKLTTIGVHAFLGCKHLTNVILPPNLVTINGGSFASTGLTKIDIPDSVEEIKYDIGAFQDTPLTEIHFGTGSKLHTVSHHAFQSTKLSSFTFGKFFKNTGNYMFRYSLITEFIVHPENPYYSTDGFTLYDKNQTTVITVVPKHGGEYRIADSVNTLKEHSLQDTTFTNIVFPEHEFFLGIACLSETKCQSFTIPNGTKAICDSCFHAAQLSSIFIPNSVTKIGVNAFIYCVNLADITFSNTLLEIHDSAFLGCTSLRNVVIPKTVTTFGNAVFSDCHKDLNVVFEDTVNFKDVNKMIIHKGNKLVYYAGKDENSEITIPSAVTKISSKLFKGAILKSVSFENPATMIIGENAFESSKIKNIVFPSTLISVGKECFMYSNIENVVWDGNEIIIPEKCFYECTNLKQITFPKNNLHIISKEAFCSTSLLTEFDFNSNPISEIGESSFERSGVQSVTFPIELNLIGSKAFFNSKVASVVVNSKVNISKYCFGSCSLLQNVNLGQSVESLDIYSFSSCEMLESITISPATKEIQSHAFDKCTSLRHITIPQNSSLKRIYPFVFEGCTNFVEFKVLDTEQFVFDEGCLMNKDKTTIIFYLPTSKTKTFVVPGTVQNIGEYAFSSCLGLKEVIISDGVIKRIQVNAFENCANLIRLILPKSLETIEQDVFVGCNKLRCGSVTFLGKEEVIKQAIASGLNEICLSQECNGKNDFFDKVTCKLFRHFSIPLCSLMLLIVF